MFVVCISICLICPVLDDSVSNVVMHKKARRCFTSIPLLYLQEPLLSSPRTCWKRIRHKAVKRRCWGAGRPGCGFICGFAAGRPLTQQYHGYIFCDVFIWIDQSRGVTTVQHCLLFVNNLRHVLALTQVAWANNGTYINTSCIHACMLLYIAASL